MQTAPPIADNALSPVSSRRWLQPANSTEMRWNSNRAATITANSASRAAGRDGCRFPTTRSASRSRKVPWIIRPPIKKVVGLPRHQQLRGIGHSQNDGPGLSKSAHKRSIGFGDIPCAQLCSCFAAHASNFNRALNTNGNPVQWAKLCISHHCCFGGSCLLQCTFSIHLHERVEFRIESFDFCEVRLNQFDRRNISTADPSAISVAERKVRSEAGTERGV